MTGWRIVPEEPTEEMWGGLARDIVMWTRFMSATGRMLHQHLTSLGRDIPEWLLKEIPNNDVVPPHGVVRQIHNGVVYVEFDDYPGKVSAAFDRDWFRINPTLLCKGT